MNHPAGFNLKILHKILTLDLIISRQDQVIFIIVSEIINDYQ